MSKMIANQFSCLLCSILKVLEVVAPFKHFNKLKEFVAMKLPAGFPVRIGWCGFICTYCCILPVVRYSSRHATSLLRDVARNSYECNTRATFSLIFNMVDLSVANFSLFILPYRDTSVSNDHSSCDVPGL